MYPSKLHLNGAAAHCAPAIWLCWLLASSALLSAQAAEEPKVLELDNGVVCRVNFRSVDVISQRDVDDRIGPKADELNGQKRELMKRGQWTSDRERIWYAEYVPLFQDALRKIVRERLLIQCAKEAKITIDEKQYQKRYEMQLKRIRTIEAELLKKGITNGVNITPNEVAEKLREAMLMESYSGRFMDPLMMPTRPEVERFYKENITRYQRPAGAKVRIIRIDRFRTKPFTNQPELVANAYDTACEIRKDLIQYGANFEEMVKKYSNDAQTRENGGLISVNPKDPYIDPETYNAQLAKAIRDLKPKEVSEVFDTKNGYMIAMVEDRREGGPAPLSDMELYNEIYTTLMELKSHKEEDKWFRSTLQKSLVIHYAGDGTPKVLGIEFFFPDDKPNPSTEKK